MTRVHAGLLLVAALAGLSAAAAEPDSPTPPRHPETGVAAARYISAPELAQRIIAGDKTLQVLDLRSTAEFEQMHVPTAQHASIESLQRHTLPLEATIVVYSENNSVADEAWSVLQLRQHRRVLILKDGLYEWIARVVEPRLALDASPSERAAFETAAAQSRFFGGVPRAEVPRADVPAGYWTGTPNASAGAGRQAVAALRRRGC